MPTGRFKRKLLWCAENDPASSKFIPQEDFASRAKEHANFAVHKNDLESTRRQIRQDDADSFASTAFRNGVA